MPQDEPLVRQTRVPKWAKIAFSIAFWAIVATLFIFANIEWLRGSESNSGILIVWLLSAAAVSTTVRARRGQRTLLREGVQINDPKIRTWARIAAGLIAGSTLLSIAVAIVVSIIRAEAPSWNELSIFAVLLLPIWLFGYMAIRGVPPKPWF